MHRGSLGNGETDTLNGDAAFIYNVAHDMGWCLNPQPQGCIILLTLYHPACAVDMTRDDVTPEARLQGESALKVYLAAWFEQTEGGHAHGLGHYVGSEGGWCHGGGCKAYAVGTDRIAHLSTLEHLRGRYFESDALGTPLNTLYGSYFFYYTCKHKTSYETQPRVISSPVLISSRRYL